MASEVSPAQAVGWLLENGPRELELLFRAIVYHPSVPILIADDDRNYRDASAGAGKLLGLSRDMVIGRKLDDFADPAFKPQISELWRALLGQGEQTGTLRLAAPDGTTTDVEYTAKGNVLPVRHLLVLHNKNAPRKARMPAKWRPRHGSRTTHCSCWTPTDRSSAWYSGAARIYGYTENEAAGQHVSMLYADPESRGIDPQQELDRASAEGHFGYEGWHARKDGSRFWANVITMALKDETGSLQGFARVVRDFSERHERDEKLRRSRARIRPVPSAIDHCRHRFRRVRPHSRSQRRFLELVGYSREDLLAGRLRWPDLTPPEYVALDELAHEEGLRFGACTPFEKELIRKDGTRVPVLVATAVLKLSPFRWITFVQDLRERDRLENVDERRCRAQSRTSRRSSAAARP